MRAYIPNCKKFLSLCRSEDQSEWLRFHSMATNWGVFYFHLKLLWRLFSVTITTFMSLTEKRSIRLNCSLYVTVHTSFVKCVEVQNSDSATSRYLVFRSVQTHEHYTINISCVAGLKGRMKLASLKRKRRLQSIYQITRLLTNIKCLTNCDRNWWLLTCSQNSLPSQYKIRKKKSLQLSRKYLNRPTLSQNILVYIIAFYRKRNLVLCLYTLTSMVLFYLKHTAMRNIENFEELNQCFWQILIIEKIWFHLASVSAN